MNYDIVIIGGGITGLATAHELSKKGYKVLIIEKQNDLGGLLCSVKINNTFIEAFYHHLFENDKFLIKKIKELGIEDRLIWRYASTAFLFPDGIYEFSSPFHIFKFKPLNWKEKIKFILLMLKIKFLKNSDELDTISAKEWIINYTGEELYKKLFYPLLKSKFGENLNDISAAWFVERINTRTNRDRKGEKLGYIKGGFKILIDKLAEDTKKKKGGIILNTAVEDIIIKDEKVIGIKANKKVIKCKCIVSTIPPQILSLLFGIFDNKFKEKINKIEYQKSLCILVSLKRKLTNYYWVNIVKKSVIGAIIEHTNFQPIKTYKNHLLYLASYPDKSSPFWKMKDQEIWKEYFCDLKKLFPYIEKEDVKWYRVFRNPEAGIIYKKGIKKNILKYQTPIYGLFIGGLFNMYPERSINRSIKTAKEITKLVDRYLKKLIKQ
ncbi:hypothetical protein DRN69_08635 [Candidatus Pacearchaeota archaeon]|nr:MAG: hypothetical protein DRN69_08635 [Candidatus Pacearchaeota archaeon]